MIILASWGGGVTEGNCFPRMGPGRYGRIQHSWAAFLEHSAKFPHSPFVFHSAADAEPSSPLLNVSWPPGKRLASPTLPCPRACREHVRWLAGKQSSAPRVVGTVLTSCDSVGSHPKCVRDLSGRNKCWAGI